MNSFKVFQSKSESLEWSTKVTRDSWFGMGIMLDLEDCWWPGRSCQHWREDFMEYSLRNAPVGRGNGAKAVLDFSII